VQRALEAAPHGERTGRQGRQRQDRSWGHGRLFLLRYPPKPASPSVPNDGDITLSQPRQPARSAT
jgi:hypothetical protein